MGWDTNHVLLTAPISDSDLAEAAGYPGTPHDGGWLIMNGLFNKWAKNKGFRSSEKGFHVDSAGIAAREVAQKAVNYGMVAPYSTNFGAYNSGFLQMLISGNVVWGYERPRGIKNTTLNPTNVDEILRVLDFHEYDRRPICPFPSIAEVSGAIGISATTKQYGFPAIPHDNAGNLGLELHDLKPVAAETDANLLDNYYVGVAIWNNNEIHYATTDYKVKDKPSYKPNFNISLTGLNETTYNVRCFLSQIPILQDEPVNPAYFVACEDTVRTYQFYYVGPGPEPFMILAELTVKNLAAPGQPPQIRYIVRITNQSGNSATISNSTLIVGDPDAIIPPVGETILLTGLNGSYANQETKSVTGYTLDEHNAGDPVTFYAEVSGVVGQQTLEGDSVVE